MKPGGDNGANLRRAGIVFAMLLATLLVCALTPAPRTTAPAVSMDLPYQIGPLSAFSQEVSQAELTILPPDTTFARKTYGTLEQNPAERILCSIVLAGKVPRSLHRPERCLPAQGYTIKDSTLVDIPLKSGHNLGANALYLQRAFRRDDGLPVIVNSYFLYWFVAEGVTTPDHFERVFLTNWDLLVHRVNQRWSYVFVHANILDGIEPHGRTAAQTLDLLKAFIRESVPYYMKAEMPPATAALPAGPPRSAG
jgi:hypothetical protein